MFLSLLRLFILPQYVATWLHYILLWTKAKFHGNMDNKGKRKSFTVSDKINTLEQADVNIGTHTELESWLGLSGSTLQSG
jgi:hypothetical protein